jgi:hypothetical protein
MTSHNWLTAPSNYHFFLHTKNSYFHTELGVEGMFLFWNQITCIYTVKSNDNFLSECTLCLLKYKKDPIREIRYKVCTRTYLNGQALAALVWLCLVPFWTILSNQIQLLSTDLHYPEKYFWHLTKILNIKVHPKKKTKKIQIWFAIAIHIDQLLHLVVLLCL